MPCSSSSTCCRNSWLPAGSRPPRRRATRPTISWRRRLPPRSAAAGSSWSQAGIATLSSSPRKRRRSSIPCAPARSRASARRKSVSATGSIPGRCRISSRCAATHRTSCPARRAWVRRAPPTCCANTQRSKPRSRPGVSRRKQMRCGSIARLQPWTPRRPCLCSPTSNRPGERHRTSPGRGSSIGWPTASRSWPARTRPDFVQAFVVTATHEYANAVGCAFRGGSICRRCGGVTEIAGAVVAVVPCAPPGRALAAAATTIMAAAEPTIRILRWVPRSMSYIEAFMKPTRTLQELRRWGRCRFCADSLKKKLRRVPPSACPGKVETGFPKRTCADRRIESASRFNPYRDALEAVTRSAGPTERIFASDASPEQRDGREGNGEPEHQDDDQQRAELGIVAATDDEQLIEILGLQLARDQSHVHQRCHEREPGRAVTGRCVERGQCQQRHQAELRERRGSRGVDQGDGAGPEAEGGFRPVMQAVEQPNIGQR